MTQPVQAPPTAFVVAGQDRRVQAYVIDLLLAGLGYAAATAAAWAGFFRHGSVVPGIALVAFGVLAVWATGVTMTALGGATPGKAMRGLRAVGATTGRPVGLRSALLRQTIRGLGGVPTLGLGAAMLAWTATVDRTGRRRGWHDQMAATVVVDVRRRREREEPGPPPMVNLTTMRLMPAPAGAAPPQGRLAPSRAPSSPRRWRVSFDTGESVLVEGLGLVGRGPAPREDEQVRHLVALDSADMSLSKTHAQFHVVPDGSLVVMDRGSTNGSTLVRAGVSRMLAARRPTTLVDGDRVRFGDREMRVAQESG